jgi:HlyD family secretion protein
MAIAVLVAAVAGGFGWVAWRRPPTDPRYQGYVEGYLVFMAPEEGGRIQTLTVEPGDRVASGQFLFSLDASMQEAQVNETKARLQQAKAQLANLNASLQRPEQIAVLRAQEERARAQLDYSRADLERQRVLFDRGYSAQSRYDQAQTAFERDKAALDEVQRGIQAGQIAGRTAEILAAEAVVQASEAAVSQAEVTLEKRRIRAPAEARVQDVYFRPGEVVNAGQPVLALLPPGNRRIRFYLPEPVLSTFSLGQTIALSCDSCPAGLTAKIVFMSKEAEFTPPVIFSDSERAKLVFRVEAQPVGEVDLPLGLPVSVARIQAGA